MHYCVCVCACVSAASQFATARARAGKRYPASENKKLSASGKLSFLALSLSFSLAHARPLKYFVHPNRISGCDANKSRRA